MQLTLKSARVNAGLTQVKAAEKIGISKETLGNYENGKTFPNARVIEKMEEVYGVSYNDIIFLQKDYG
jgi:transcriptional regulator with XRE-family HTH domain